MKSDRVVLYLKTAFLLAILAGCSKPDTDKIFTVMPASHTNIHFSNDLEITPDFNIQNYLYYYDGGGVAVGDLTNNGLPDLFFTGNMVQNRLYFNMGHFVFKDVTEQAGIVDSPDSWSKGVTMADVTGNGYLDIYVSRVNYRTKRGANQFFVNNGDGTFTEKSAQYGIDFKGYSTQAVFFDYNKNGRLDLFLLNHTHHSEYSYGPAEPLRAQIHPEAGDRLFRNDGSHFTDITKEAGIFSAPIGYGLGLAIVDINQNGWPDIYVGNDFQEDDYFYINNGDGTFTEMLYEMITQTSYSSMGNDFGDINNNGRMDFISLDMMPENHRDFLRSGGPDVVAVANMKKDLGYGEKNNRNTLQINRGILSEHSLPVFSETAFTSGVARTDWSWASIFADFNNSGKKDLFVTNGMPLRPNDLDYIHELAELRDRFRGEELKRRELQLMNTMPEVHVPNYMFKNNGALPGDGHVPTFSNVTNEWGLGIPSYSSGAVYADLNGNGFLDLIVNNTNEPVFIFKNNSEPNEFNRYLTLTLSSDGYNSTGIGAKVFVYSDDRIFYREQYPTRGFQSSVDHRLHIGMGESEIADSVVVIWPDDSWQTLYNVAANQHIVIEKIDASGKFDYQRLHQTEKLVVDISYRFPEEMAHIENDFDDFYREPLLPYKQSRRGPAIAIADVTDNGFDDVYIGGARGYSGRLFLQISPGEFEEKTPEAFEADKASEDTDAIFFDANGNGLLDLYVVSGGNEYVHLSPELTDRLYLNNGEGMFSRSENSLPQNAFNGSVVAAADINGNGHIDLFVGGHTIPWRFGIAPESMLLKNNGDGTFKNGTKDVAPELLDLGMVTSASFIMNAETQLPDLIVAGEWMPLRYFRNNNGRFEDVTETTGMGNLHGLWQSLHVDDVTGNGNLDIIAGNIGLNTRLSVTDNEPAYLFVDDFDRSGNMDPIVAIYSNGKLQPFEQLDELTMQMPGIRSRVESYTEFSQMSMTELFGAERIENAAQNQINELRSYLFINRGNNTFQAHPLPLLAQISPVMAISTMDIQNDGINEIFIAGNIYDVKPGYGGMQGSHIGLILQTDESGNFTIFEPDQSGFYINAEARIIKPVYTGENNPILFVGSNNDNLRAFQVAEDN